MRGKAMFVSPLCILCLVAALSACGDKDSGAAAAGGDNDTGASKTETDTAKTASDTTSTASDTASTASDTASTAPDTASTASDTAGADGGVAGKYKWFKTCGAPVCKTTPWKPTPGVPLCVDQKEGGACSKAGDKCDAKLPCQEMLVCAEKDPKQQQGGCPISSRRYKTDIRYLTPSQEKRFAAELLGMSLSSWLYRDGDDKRHLGFIIEDVPGSVAVDKTRERVDLYSYISMAVATLKVQQRRIERLERRVRALDRDKSRPKSSVVPSQQKARR